MATHHIAIAAEMTIAIATDNEFRANNVNLFAFARTAGDNKLHLHLLFSSAPRSSCTPPSLTLQPEHDKKWSNMQLFREHLPPDTHNTLGRFSANLFLQQVSYAFAAITRRKRPPEYLIDIALDRDDRTRRRGHIHRIGMMASRGHRSVGDRL
jgi:hypothetical protein